MAFSSPAAMAAGLILLLSIPLASAQVPPLPGLEVLDDPEGQFLNFVATMPQSYAEVPYLGRADLPLIIRDLSRDSAAVPEAGLGGGNSPSGHSVELRLVAIHPPEALGWQVLVGQPFIPLSGGEVVETSISIQTDPQINTRFISAEIEAVFTGPNGYTRNQTLLVNAMVPRYDMWLAQVTTPPIQAGQFESVQFEVRITNSGLYPDSFTFTVSSDYKELQIIAPPNLYVPAQSERTTNVTVLTPKGTPYEFGKNGVITVQVSSLSSNAVYPAIGLLKVSGPYIPVYWVPLLLVGLVSAGVVTRERILQSGLAGEEKGTPRRVQPTPRQAVLLAELKRRDPEAYKAKREALAALYASRRQTYRGERKQRAAMDREERHQARLELKEEKRRLAQEAKAAAAQAKVEKKAAATQAKLDRKQAKLDAKVAKKEEKVLAKKRKVLEKQKAKLEKQHAKEAKVEAKAQAKADKAAAKAAKREERAARKREKSR